MTDLHIHPAARADHGNTFVFLLLLSLLPLIGAQFGYGNQIEQLSIITRLINPEFAAGDFYVDSAAHFGPRVYYAHALAFLAQIAPLPLVMHGMMVLTSLLLGAVSFHAARRLLGLSWAGAALAAVLCVTNGGVSLGLAGYLRFDSYQPANPAIALALVGAVLLMRGRVWMALPAFVAAGLLHPLVGSEVAMLFYGAAFVAALAPRGAGEAGARPGPILVSGLGFLIAMGAAWALPGLGAGGSRPDGGAIFDILVRFRAPHHYFGLDFPRQSWRAALLFVAAAALAIVAVLRRTGLSRAALTMILAAAGTLVLCGASLYFVDIAQSPLWATAQMFRMLMVVKWVGFLFLGGWLAHAGGRAGAPALLVIALAVIATGDANGYGMIIAVAALGAMALAGPRPMLRWAIAAVAALAIAYWIRRSGVAEEAVRAAIGLALAALMLRAAPVRLFAAIAMTFALVAVTATTRHEGLLGWSPLAAQYVWSDLSSPEADIARQAAGIGAPQDLWIVPPKFESFRLLSGHPVVADFTSIPLDPSDIPGWRARIEALYGPVAGNGFAAQRSMTDNYRTGTNLGAAAAAYGARYAVLFSETLWGSPALADNGTYKVVALGAR